MNLFSRVGLSCALFCLLPACGGLTTYHRVVQPTTTAQACKGASDSGGSVFANCGINLYTTCPPAWTLEDLAGKPPEVGSNRIHDDGTEPLPCWKWASTATRAYVNFNVIQIPKIVKVVTARLTWDAWSSHQHGATPSSNQPPHCFKRLYEATAPWSVSSGTPGNLISDELDQPPLAKGIATEELRQVIQKWADTGVPFGFYTCSTILKTLRLEITYLGKPELFP